MLFDMKDKVVLITGASGGLGAFFAHTLAQYGAHVVITARNQEKLNAVKTSIISQYPKCQCLALTMDVTDSPSIESVVDTIGQTFQRLDVVINNAGNSASASLRTLDEADWDAVMATHLKGSWLVAKQALALLGAQKGCVINIASILGLRVQKGVGPYTTAKAGLIQLTKAMALEWARLGVRVNALAPGYFPTDMSQDFLTTNTGQEMVKRIPCQRTGELSELAGPLLLLASQAGSYINGCVLPVDGGHLISSL